MNDADILVALGDVTRVAQELKLSKSTVANWKARGVPWHWRERVKALARKKRVPVPVNFVTAKPHRQRNAIAETDASPAQPESAVA